MVPWSIKGEKEQPQPNTGNSQQVSQMSRAGLEWHYAPRTEQPHRCVSFRPEVKVQRPELNLKQKI